VLILVAWCMRIRMSRYLAATVYFLVTCVRIVGGQSMVGVRRHRLRRQFRRIVRESWPGVS